MPGAAARCTRTLAVAFALEAFQGGVIVTDGHHDRVLEVGRNGAVSELIGFDNIVRTGLAISGMIPLPNTGAIPRVNDNRTFSVVIDGLNQPSLEIIGTTPLSR